MECLFDRVIEWEKENGLYRIDAYNPWFDHARGIAKQLGFKPSWSKDGSSFGAMYPKEQVAEILEKLAALEALEGGK